MTNYGIKKVREINMEYKALKKCVDKFEKKLKESK